MSKKFLVLTVIALIALPLLVLAAEPDVEVISTDFPTTPGAEQVYGTDGLGPLAIIVNLYRFALMIGGGLAFAMILWGGIKYLTSGGSHHAEGEAKDIIRDAFLGLLLLAGAYLVLLIVNPDLTKLQLPMLKRLEKPPAGASPINLIDPGSGFGNWGCLDENNGNLKGCYETSEACKKACGDRECPQSAECKNFSAAGNKYGYEGAALPPGDNLDDATARGMLSNAQISVNKGNCTQAGQTNCTSLTGIPKRAIDGLVRIADACNCQFRVTGGTEAGHQTHQMGKPIVDLGADTGITNYIAAITGQSPATILQLPNMTKLQANGVVFLFERQDGVAHWHVVFQ